MSDPNVKAVLVNIFGGIMKCDIIAEGIVQAAKDVGVKIPLVVRLQGTNVDKGRKILNESGLNIISAEQDGRGREKAVQAVKAQSSGSQERFHPFYKGGSRKHCNGKGD